MESLPDALGGLSSLSHLRIETASLPYLPDSVGHLGSLRELVLSYCHCLQVQCVLVWFAGLYFSLCFMHQQMQKNRDREHLECLFPSLDLSVF